MFIKLIGVSPLIPREPSVEKAYEKLVECFSTYYSYPGLHVEKLIRNRMRKGLSREEAIIQLYNEILRDVSEKVLARRIETRMPVPFERKGFLELLSYVLSAYSTYPSISIPIFIRDAATTITEFTGLILIVLVALQFDALGVLDRLLVGDLGVLLEPAPRNIALLAVALFFTAFAVARGLSNALYAVTLYPQAQDLLEKGKLNYEQAFLRGFRRLKQSFLLGVLIDIPLAALLFFLIYFSLFGHLLCIRHLLILIGLGGAFLVVRLLTIYSLQAIVLEGIPSLRAIKVSVEVLKKTFSSAMGYALILILVYILSSLVASIFAGLGVPISTAASFFVSLMFVPSLDTALTGIYLQSRGFKLSLEIPKRDLTDMVKDKLSRSLEELKTFITREGYKYTVLAVVILSLGSVIGLFIGQGAFKKVLSKILLRGRINPIFQKYLFIALASEIFFHNWRVSLMASLSGILTPLIPILIDLLNGIILGFAASRYTPYEFLVTMMPHGIIEIPGLIIALGAGLKLGLALMKSLKEAISEIRRTVYVAIGLIPIFLVAALIESSVTPLLIRMLLEWE